MATGTTQEFTLHLPTDLIERVRRAAQERLETPKTIVTEALQKGHVTRTMALRQLGFVQRSAGNLSASAKAFERATALDRRDKAALVALAEVYLASGNAPGAVTEASRALAVADDAAAWRAMHEAASAAYRRRPEAIQATHAA